MSKKILSVVLALVLVMSASFTAFAATVGYEEEDTKNTQEWALSEPVDNGDGTWTVEVSLKANYPVGGIQFTIENTDNKKVVLDKAVAGAGIPANWNASVTKSNTTGKVAINPKPTDDDAVDAITFGNETTGYTAKVVAILTYKVAEGGSSKINIKNDPKTAAKPGGTLIAARMANGNVVTDGDSPIVGQNVTSVGVTRNIGAAQAKPELVLNNGVTVNKNYCNTEYTGVMFGFPDFGTEAKIRSYVTSTLGDEYIAYEAYNGNRHGSGVVIKLLDLDKTTVLESYVVVIFGDCNFDGRVNVTDISYLVVNRPTISKSSGPDKIACNIDGDSRKSVNTNDISSLVVRRPDIKSYQQTLAAIY